MKLTRFMAVLAVAGGMTWTGALPGDAQIREQQPAEFPAKSYKGKQYVDSKGCVFIRAGIDGNVTWVPRVSRDRKIICGFKPTGVASVASTTDAPATKPVQIVPETTTAASAKPVARPAPQRVAQAATPKPKVKKKKVKVVRQTAPRPAPKPVVVATPAPAKQSVPVRLATACPGASALSQQYLRGSGVRCGPQSEPVVGVRTTRVVTSQPAVKVKRQLTGRKVNINPNDIIGIPYTDVVKENTRIVPKHVAQNRINTRNVQVPKGYKQVWEDDRLNPYRAEQTLTGRADMLLVWTQTLPRRLINQSTGKDVTASVPLVYPYTTYAQQQRELGEVDIVQRDGQIMKRIVRNVGSRKKATRAPVYSTRSAPRKAPVKAVRQAQPLASKTYVQVGRYKDAASAQSAARAVAGMGLAARIGKHRKGSATYMTVQAGPFHDRGTLNRAIRKLRAAGYRTSANK